jgi:hypothetical protein
MQAIINDIKNIKSRKKELREFGLTIGGALILFGLIALWRGKASSPYLVGSGVLFALSGMALPGILKPLQKVWMSFSVVMGFFMSRVILCILFYGVVTPIGLVLRISGKDILDEKIDRQKTSYWSDISKDIKVKESYEKQF